MGTTAKLIRRFVALYNDGSPDSYGSDAFLQLYAEDVDWAETPTAMTPDGRSGDLRAIRAAVAFGQSVFRDRRLSIDEIVEDGDRAVWTGTWSATIGVDGLEVPKGTRVQLRQAMLIQARAGRIVRQRDFLGAPVFSDSAPK